MNDVGKMKMEIVDASQEVLHFNSQQSGWASGLKSGSDPTMTVAHTSDTNDAFLGRPVKIFTQLWPVGGSLHFTFDPWSLFCNNSKVVNRLAHFKNLRGTLIVKFQLNGNPFYYGRLMMSYNPLANSDEFTASRDNVLQDRIAASQRPKVFLDPTTNQGGELICPFIYPKNTLDIPSAEWGKMGNITCFTLNALQHANDSTDPVTVTAYAWMVDYDLSTPTSQLPSTIVPQMECADDYEFFPEMMAANSAYKKANGDEYGIVSGPAHTAANFMGKLATIPKIGKYARATEMVASKISSIAQLFGFSKPRAIAVPRNLIESTVELAVTNVQDNSLSLALDAKKEITVDPTVTGASDEDEMAIVPLAMKESYVTSFGWSVANPSDTHLFSIRVRPTQGDVINTDGGGIADELHMTPSSWVSLPFEYWTGSMDFRFQIVCSAYHRGRLRFVWDPDVYTGNDYNVNYSEIVDISNGRDFKFRIGWGQNTTYLPVSGPLNNGASQDLFPSFTPASPGGNPPAPYTTKEPYSNGTLSVYVVNELTSPSDTGDLIEVNVYANAAEDFEVASPSCQWIENFAAADRTPGSGDIDPPNPRNPGGNPAPSVPPLDQPNLGNNFNQPGSPDDLVFKQVNPFGVMFVDPADIDTTQSRPFSYPQYSNQIGVASDRTMLVNGTHNYIMKGRGQPSGFSGTSTFVFKNASTDARIITITNPAGAYTSTLPGNIGGVVQIDVPFAFFGNGEFEDVQFSIAISPGNARVLLEKVGTAMYSYESVISYSNVNIAANSPDFTTSGNKAVGLVTESTIVGPNSVSVGQPGSWITTTPAVIDGINLDHTVGNLQDTFALPAPFIWRDDGSGNAVVAGTPTDAVPINVLDFYTVAGMAPEMPCGDFYPEMDGVEGEEDDENNAPEIDVIENYFGPPVVSGPSNQVFFGEQIASWRQILKRATKKYTVNGNGQIGPSEIIIPQYPIFTDDLTSANLTLVDEAFNIYRWVSSAYVCERGSYRIKLIAGMSGSGNSQWGSLYATRVPNTSNATPGISQNYSMDISHCGSASSFMTLAGRSEIEVPWYSNYRFIQSRNSDLRDPDNFIERQLVKIGFGHSAFVRGTIAYSAGEDYSLSNFLSVPIFVFQNI